ncbi:hypothetical protein KQI52_06830 [bacterium]|nr:hypothetical protein [bacterium]
MNWHRVSNAPIEAILEGWIDTPCNTLWRLSDQNVDTNDATSIHFIEDVTGLYDENVPPVPLSWEYKIDLGDWQIVEVGDGYISIPMPAGYHTFSLKVTGSLPYNTTSGHYNLTLHQLMMPQL